MNIFLTPLSKAGFRFVNDTFFEKRIKEAWLEKRQAGRWLLRVGVVFISFSLFCLTVKLMLYKKAIL